ncbi:ankyrin repeat domain-containing protein 12 [Coccinella septempunctata]|uniref:ankyrin repeat domain-containing protein 12 n=1 Tax=Coccinella septempunctata TaxID=41139 RepID=UPI001D061EB1|nr:ankyrin repeat domain-containing protein 12 [Coccinella septempunctata]
MRSKESSAIKSHLQTPMSERQQLALLMQMTSGNESIPKSPGGTNYSFSRQKDRNERGETSLHLAAIKGDIEQVNKLLSNRADPNVTDFAGWTPLHEACNYGWYEIAIKLVQAGANVNAKGLDNDTPLHDAVINGHLNIMKLLIEHGADINYKNTKGKSPLDMATPMIKPYVLNPSLPIPESMVPSRVPPRGRDDKKLTDNSKTKSNTTDENTESGKAEDAYEFKSTKDQTEQKTFLENEPTGETSTAIPTSDETVKRGFQEMNENVEENTEDESRKKKRKDEGTKEKGALRGTSQNKGQAGKPNSDKSNKSSNLNVNKAVASDKKSPCPSPKVSSDVEDDSKVDLKVPPLKIVIPQTNSNEQEAGVNRSSKNNSQRTHQALPYVVPSSSSNLLFIRVRSIIYNNLFSAFQISQFSLPPGASSNDSNNDKDLNTSSGQEENASKPDEKKEGAASTSADDQRGSANHQRVLRSSHKGGGQSQIPDRSSNNSSPQLHRSHSPSPSASPSAPNTSTDAPVTTSSALANTISKTTDSQLNNENETSSTSSTSTNATTATPAPVELHPRKRKMKPSKEPAAPPADTSDVSAESQIHPHEQPITNCYQLFLDIRKQIEKRRKGLFPVQPKPPQGFKDYLMNRCTYVLANTTSTSPNVSYPPNLPPQMKDIFTDQEKERYRLRMQHVIEKEKLVLSVEQEILRVHGRAARALANQSLPFSVCSILRDEEVYNLITPEQEEKDRNARSRYNGRLFLSWLQDVDDKWEKIKEHMLLRHHNEAESLHAVQKMDWEWKMIELNLCDRKSTPTIEEHHVPMVHVSDDFDLLPA